MMFAYTRGLDCCQIMPPAGKIVLLTNEIVIPLRELPSRAEVTIHISLNAVEISKVVKELI